MRLHKHIPTLYELAIYDACDSVVRRGPGAVTVDRQIESDGQLRRVFIYVLYLKCIVAFANKHDKSFYGAEREDVVTLFHKYCRNDLPDDVVDLDPPTLLATGARIKILDHLDIDDTLGIDSVGALIRTVDADDDFKSFLSCLNRFACRCIAARQHVLLSRIMTSALSLGEARVGPFRALSQALAGHGGQLDDRMPLDDHIVKACTWGLSNALRHSIEIAARAGQALTLDPQELLLAVESGGIECAIVASSLAHNRHLPADCILNVREFDVEYCNQLLALHLLHRGYRYRLTHVRSTDVLQWFINHQIVFNIGDVLKDVVKNAVESGHPYSDVLNIMICHMHIAVPRDIISDVIFDRTTDLGVLDTLLGHGSVLGLSCAYHNPLLVGYWVIKGVLNQVVDIKRLSWDLIARCIQLYHTDPVAVDVLLNMFIFVNISSRDIVQHTVPVDGQRGNLTLLHCACAVGPPNTDVQLSITL